MHFNIVVQYSIYFQIVKDVYSTIMFRFLEKSLAICRLQYDVCFYQISDCIGRFFFSSLCYNFTAIFPILRIINNIDCENEN